MIGLATMGGLVTDKVDLGMDPVGPTKEAGGDPLKGPWAPTLMQIYVSVKMEKCFIMLIVKLNMMVVMMP